MKGWDKSLFGEVTKKIHRFPLSGETTQAYAMLRIGPPRNINLE